MHRLALAVRCRTAIVARPASQLAWSHHSRRSLTTGVAGAAAADAVPSPPLPVIQVVRLDHLRLPVATQLRIEEALLRGNTAKHANYCVLNHPPPAEQTIVMGISNRTELLVHLDQAERDGVHLLRRFSGGGTVFIDDQCWMSTLIINRTADDATAAEGSEAAAQAALQAKRLYTDEAAAASATHSYLAPVGVVHPSSLQCFPNRLMDWTRDFYAPIFNPAFVDEQAVLPFSLTGSDYCFASRKFGGNAQTITKGRWLHHTSFLWSLDSLPRITRYLKNPKKQPEYRAGRAHSDFLVSLREVWTTVEKHAAASSLELHQFDQTNEPSDAELFRSVPSSRPFGDVPPDSSLAIPSALPSRLLWRFSHFFTLQYPSLDEIASLVEAYDQQAASSIKRLDYDAERARIRLAEEEEVAKQAALQAAAASAGSSA